MNPRVVRKELLVAACNVQRRQFDQDSKSLALAVDGLAREFGDRVRSAGALASSAAFVFSAASLFRRRPVEPQRPGRRGSLLTRTISAARRGWSVWSAWSALRRPRGGRFRDGSV